MAPSARMDTFPLREIVSMQIGARAVDEWRISEDDDWCHVFLRDHPIRVQGWKLHVSATWLSAPIVLHQAAQILVKHRCPFKFARTVGRAWDLSHKTTERSQAGKFLTAYPRDDHHLRELAPLLDEATAGMPGPSILSDRPFREGSLVHYRYGAFTGVPVLTHDAVFEARLEAPDGTLVEDMRQPWFCPPPWTTPPYEGPPVRDATPPTSPPPVVVADRFQVTGAITHSARGGVYRATDLETGRQVVVKQARAHICGLSPTGDARDELRREASMLRALAGLGPREVLLSDQGGHLFLAVEAIDGETLTVWTRRRWDASADPDPSLEGPPVTEVVAMAARLAEIVDAVHARGLVLRDLTPNNVMVVADGSLRLIDAELVTRPGERVSNAHTPGFAAPELVTGPPVQPAPGPSGDHFALGALLCFISTGMTPAFPPDLPAPPYPPTGERIAGLLRYACPRSPAASRLAPAIRGLTADNPEERWDTDRLRTFLNAAPPSPDHHQPASGDEDGRLAPAQQRRLLEDGLAHLATAISNAPPNRLVTSNRYGNRNDPCNVQHGSAGVLAVLVRGSELLDDPSLHAAARHAARWTDRQRTAISPLLPGLYFGRAGTAWALYDAARHLDDHDLAERALELATMLPIQWPNPDITHGTAGVGLAHLYLWSQTKEPALLDRVTTAVDHLLEHARGEGVRAYWQVAPHADSKLAGLTHLGFAHGVAGIGTFLLAAASATGRNDARRMAERAGVTLAETAIRSAGAAYWPNEPTGPGPTDLRYHWCSGASGVGTFLVRLWHVTKAAQYWELAHEAAVAVRLNRWFSSPHTCHGLAGNGEFLLDMAAVSDGPYRDWAEELAACLYLRAARREGRLIVPERPDGPVNLDFGTGLAGVVGYALRLRYGGPRWWMVDTPRPEGAFPSPSAASDGGR